MTADPYFRYQNDVWYFGILLKTGKTLVIECIENVYDEYISVRMMDKERTRSICESYDLDPEDYICSTCSREVAIVRKENIVMIFEMADT